MPDVLISDPHQFAFIHVPKTGGSSIRRAIAAYDSYGGAFADVHEHPVLGRIDLGHLPLGLLREHFPVEYEKLHRYFTLAIVRDPYSRFPSGLRQRLHWYRDPGLPPPSEMTPAQVLREAYAAIELIQKQTDRLSPEIIHLAPQAPYVSEGGRLAVSALLPAEAIDAAVPDLLREHLGLEITMARANHSRRYAHRSLAGLARAAGWLAGRGVPGVISRRALSLTRRFQVAGNPLADVVLAQPDIRAFIETHYAADFELYEEARQRWLPGGQRQG